MRGDRDRPSSVSNEEVDELGVREIKSEKEFEDMKMNELFLVDFSAPWCAPCRLQEPILGQLAAQFEGKALVGAVKIDESRDVASNTGIQSIPTLILYKNGKEVERFVGLQSKGTLSGALEKLLK